MADVAVTPTTLVAGTASASILDANGTSIAAAANNVWAIAAGGKPGERVLLKFLGVTSSTISILAGDRPPSQRVDLGALTFAITTTQVMYIMVDTGRHLQNDGTIRASVNTGDTTTCKAFIIPKYY